MEGNYKALRRMRLLKRMLKDMGIEEHRFRLEWISASEGDRVKTVINEMTEQVRALGPLGLPKKFKEWDKEMELLENEVNGKEEAVHA
jgi:F420-non-reducing hydrogenase iron-sulfur subunit